MTAHPHAPSPAVARSLLDVARARPLPAGRTRVVAIDGPSGAGKTTLADVVLSVLTEQDQRRTVIHMDDLYPGWDGLEAAVPLLVEAVLRPLAAGRDGSYRRYDWDRETYAERHRIPAGTPWLVVEGVGCGSTAARPHLSALAWVEADRDTRLRRGLERDGETYRPHWERWARQEARLFGREGTRDHADVVVDTR